MRRLARHVFRIICALSLLLCVISLAMLLRSIFVRDELSWARAGGSLVAVQTIEEGVSVTVVGPAWPQDRGLSWRRVEHSDWRSVERAAWSRNSFRPDYLPGGIRIQRGPGYFSRGGAMSNARAYPITAVQLRWDTIALLFALLPATTAVIAFRRRRLRRKRSAAGLCLSCGYDLRATPELCPECGAANARLHDVDAATP